MKAFYLADMNSDCFYLHVLKGRVEKSGFKVGWVTLKGAKSFSEHLWGNYVNFPGAHWSWLCPLQIDTSWEFPFCTEMQALRAPLAVRALGPATPGRSRRMVPHWKDKHLVMSQ